jgi:hypothetical protein
VERGVVLDPPRRLRPRGGLRGRHERPRAGGDPVPAPGEILFYPGGHSETEILFPYAGTIFASKLGQLAGNHFLTITEGRENLRPLGELCLWEGAQDIVFDRA